MGPLAETKLAAAVFPKAHIYPRLAKSLDRYSTFSRHSYFYEQFRQGGAFADILGSLEVMRLVEPRDIERVEGVLINKFRGDRDVLEAAIAARLSLRRNGKLEGRSYVISLLSSRDYRKDNAPLTPPPRLRTGRRAPVRTALVQPLILLSYAIGVSMRGHKCCDSYCNHYRTARCRAAGCTHKCHSNSDSRGSTGHMCYSRLPRELSQYQSQNSPQSDP